MNHPMSTVGRDIFRAIHEGKWLYIEYRNKSNEVTRYWFGIESIDIDHRMLLGTGLHLKKYSLAHSMKISVPNIQSTQIVDGTYLPANQELLEDIRLNPAKYEFLFHSASNLKVLSYLSDCNRMDGVPSLNRDFHLIDRLDDETAVKNKPHQLTQQQFTQIVDAFAKDTYHKADQGQGEVRQLCLNKLSLHTPKGLYVLAYREMALDVVEKTLRPSATISYNKEFTISVDAAYRRETESISRFLDGDELSLLDDFEGNLTEIEECIERHICGKMMIDEMPYLLCLQRQCPVDLEKEYQAIIQMYASNAVSFPIRAFFGELHEVAANEQVASMALLNRQVNLDQLLSIYNAMNYPVSYIQGPPGTGKTNTILNAIVSAYFNNRTVLFSSYNNHPIDTVFAALSSIEYRGGGNKKDIVPFPILRLGNSGKVSSALQYIRALYERAKSITVYDDTLFRKKYTKIERTKKLVDLLRRHQEAVDLEERRDTLESLIDRTPNVEFQMVLEGQQLSQIKKRLSEIGTITDEDALDLLHDDRDFMKYLYYSCAGLIQQLSNPEYQELWNIIGMKSDLQQVSAFNKYTSNPENLALLQRVFPIISTTCISAHRLGNPSQHFDLTIIDEASQCNTAISLIPIIRGKGLMLVGDPQQLNPVITLDPGINRTLRERYQINDDYDYIANSIYKTFLANDAVSTEILLHNHYRCAREIIHFNNKKYYNNKLRVCKERSVSEPLVFYDVRDRYDNERNTSKSEAQVIINYIKDNPGKSIGIITPFRNQKELIEFYMEQEGIDKKDYPVGTVHAFQGDEKDEILFFLALTGGTRPKTYDWVRNNKELINVATSRARDKLILISDGAILDRLHTQTKDDNGDDLYELAEYVRSRGSCSITQRETTSRALGTKPYKTETERVFLTTLTHALSNAMTGKKKFSIQTEVQISHLFKKNLSSSDFFYKGSFDFVIYRVGFRGKLEPVIAIELNGREHYEDEKVKRRDEEKMRICREQGFQLIQVENSYARRYNFIKQILNDYFQSM